MKQNDQQFMAQKISAQYVAKENSELDTLCALDAKVKRPAKVFSYVFGSISAIMMGAGMSLVMTDLASKLGLGDMMVPGIIIGVVGLALALLTYPIYKRIMNARKKKYAPEILALSDALVNS